MSENEGLELWKRRKLLEMKRRFLLKKAGEAEKREEEKQRTDPKSVLNRIFVGRAWEVLEAAERQYPQLAHQIKEALVRAVLAGELKGPINGEQLFWLFRRLGIRIRLETRIRILESGELKTIEDKLKER